MHSILALLRLFREYLFLIVFSAVSIILIARSDAAPVQVLRSYSLALFSSLHASSGWLTDILVPRSRTESLRSVNVSLMEEVMQLRRLRQENEELRRKIGFKERASYPLVPAEILGKKLEIGQLMVTLNVGSSDSVQVNMPVINESGLIGKIVATTPGYSIAQLALHRMFSASAKVKRSRIDGIINWEDGQMLRLQNVWKTSDILVGDTIVTSEYSNIYPPEIMIGTVQEIGSGEGGMFTRVIVKPQVDFSTLERVFVVRYRRSIERQALEEAHLDDSGTRP